MTEHCRQTVIDIVEEEWQKEEEDLTEVEHKSEIGQTQLERGRPSMEATVQRVGTCNILIYSEGLLLDPTTG